MKNSRLIATGALLLMGSAPAWAHLVETGFGDFYDGAVHALVTPADLLVVLALAMLAGQNGVRVARRLLFAIPVAWFVALMAGLFMLSGAVSPYWTTASFMLAGVLVASNVRVPEAFIVVLAMGLSMLHGLFNGVAMAKAGVGSTVVISGMICTIFIIVTVVSAEISALKAGWPQIAVRVAGSWIAAAGLLMIGWLVKEGVASPFFQAAG